MCNYLDLWDSIDDDAAERACSLLLQPNERKLSQLLNGYGRIWTQPKKLRRSTALLCALCLIDDEIGIPSIIRAVNRLCDTSTINEVNEETMKDFLACMKMDRKAKEIMREIVNKLCSMSEDIEHQKIARKYEVRMNFIEHQPKTDIPFRIDWY